MSALTSVVKVMDGPLGTRFCFLSLLVFFCAIELVDALESSPTTGSIVLRRPGNLTQEQLRSAVTIEFDFSGIDKQQAVAVRGEVRRKILEYLNRRKKSTVAVPTVNPSTTTYAIPTSTAAITTTSNPSTTVTVTSTPVASTTTTAAPTTTPAVETTAEITTTVVTSRPTTKGMVAIEKRKKRNIGGNSDTFTEEDVVVIGNGNIFNESGNMRITINVNAAAIGNLSELLNEVVGAFDKSGEFGASPVKINKGLPKASSPVETPLGFNFWLPVLLASNAFLLIFIFIFVFNWRSRSKKRSAGELEREQLIPVLMV